MKTKMKKILLLLCCALLLVSVSVGVTVAYLTSTSTEVKNTFTIGDVKIDLDEAAVEYNAADNTYVDKGTRVQQNTYNILPGTVVYKDPTITVDMNSENCYVRALVTITYPKGTFEADWLSAPGNGWEISTTTATETTDATTNEVTCTMVQEYRYKTVVGKNTASDTVLSPIFTTLTIPTTLTNTDIAKLKDFKIDVVGHAIQAGGFADADAAWTAFGTQIN